MLRFIAPGSKPMLLTQLKQTDVMARSDGTDIGVACQKRVLEKDASCETLAISEKNLKADRNGTLICRNSLPCTCDRE